MPTVQDIYKELKETLGSTESELEARIIIEDILGFSATDLIVKSSYALSSHELQKIRGIRDTRRDEKIPLAYILEESRFFNFKIFVNKDVLIPRPETEILVEKTLEEIKTRRISKPRILDLCTGSGCIAVALKHFLPAADIYAADISKAALDVATINAKNHSLDIKFVLGDYLDPFVADSYKSSIAVPVIKGPGPYFDVIISNPPYVSEEEYKDLEAELFHEPKHALVGFPYKHIKNQAQGLIKENGFLAFEFGQGQSEKIKEIFPKSSIYQDYAGIDRVVVADLAADL